MNIKPSTILASVAWGCTFFAGLSMFLRSVPADALSWSLFVLFFIVALFASAVSSNKKVQPQ